jgi:predicted esterase
VRRGLPPILTIHGNADSIVPYEHAVRLHQALRKAKVDEQLHTIEGGGHGGFSYEESLEAMAVIRRFLTDHGIID